MGKKIDFDSSYDASIQVYKNKFNYVVPEPPNITEEFKFFLAGFVEGEGSLNVSIKKADKNRVGCFIDPEFSVSQHNRAPDLLFGYAKMFKTGWVTPGNNHALHACMQCMREGEGSKADFAIGDRTVLLQKVIPFYKNYVFKYGSSYKKDFVIKFEHLLNLYQKGAHLTMRGLIDEIGPLAFELRSSKARKDTTFLTFNDFKKYLLSFCKTKLLNDRNLQTNQLNEIQVFNLFDQQFPTQGVRS